MDAQLVLRPRLPSLAPASCQASTPAPTHGQRFRLPPARGLCPPWLGAWKEGLRQARPGQLEGPPVRKDLLLLGGPVTLSGNKMGRHPQLSDRAPRVAWFPAGL